MPRLVSCACLWAKPQPVHPFRAQWRPCAPSSVGLPAQSRRPCFPHLMRSTSRWAWACILRHLRSLFCRVRHTYCSSAFASASRGFPMLSSPACPAQLASLVLATVTTFSPLRVPFALTGHHHGFLRVQMACLGACVTALLSSSFVPGRMSCWPCAYVSLRPVFAVVPHVCPQSWHAPLSCPSHVYIHAVSVSTSLPATLIVSLIGFAFQALVSRNTK